MAAGFTQRPGALASPTCQVYATPNGLYGLPGLARLREALVAARGHCHLPLRNSLTRSGPTTRDWHRVDSTARAPPYKCSLYRSAPVGAVRDRFQQAWQLDRGAKWCSACAGFASQISDL